MCFINRVFRFLFIASSFALLELTIAKRTLRSLETSETTLVSMNYFGNPNELDETKVSQVFKDAYDSNQEESTQGGILIQGMELIDESDAIRRRLPGSRRRLDDGEVQFDFTFFFLISFNCNGCRGGGIFRNDGSRRRLFETEDDPRPTRNDFTKRFNKLLRTVDIGVNVLNQVSELEEEEQCEERDEGFTQNVKVRFKGNYYELVENNAEIGKLEQAVKKSYNTLNAPNPTTCDLLSRWVTNVQYESSHEVNPNTFLMIFTITYNCRGCQGLRRRERKLFSQLIDDFDSGREDLFADFRETSVSEPDCVCGREANLYRSPTKKEFKRSLRKFLDIRSEEGTFTAIADVSGG